MSIMSVEKSCRPEENWLVKGRVLQVTRCMWVHPHFKVRGLNLSVWQVWMITRISLRDVCKKQAGCLGLVFTVYGGLASELCYLTASPGCARKHVVSECTSNQIGVRVVLPFLLWLQIFLPKLYNNFSDILLVQKKLLNVCKPARDNLTPAFNLTTADAANYTLLPNEVIYLEDGKWKHIV